MRKSTAPAATTKDGNKAAKPDKPHPDFPLFPHGCGYWAKKIKGKCHYFGKWDDPQAALELWLQQKDDLLAGRSPRVSRTSRGGLTVRELVNKFMNAKRRQVAAGDLTTRSWQDYHGTCARLVKAFGVSRVVSDLHAEDFARLRDTIVKTRAGIATGNEIQRVRTVFKYGYDNHLFDTPVRYGTAFNKPSARTLRLERHSKGPRMYLAADLRKIVAAAGVPLKAMILLGVNCGFGNGDCGGLTQAAVDLDGGWVTYPRPKTGVQRRCWLWPETVEALKAAIAERPAPKSKAAAGLVFLTKYGAPWAKVQALPAALATEVDGAPVKAGGGADNPVSKEFTKVLKDQGLHRPGLGFYALRHTFETIAGESRDQVAVNAIMGHAPIANDMSAVYREGISDARLRAVAEHVRGWLWPAPVAAPPQADAPPASKLAQVKAMMAAGDHAAALKLCASWGHRGLGGGEDADAIAKGYAALQHADTYRDMGYDPDELVAAGVAAIRRRYNLTNNG